MPTSDQEIQDYSKLIDAICESKTRRAIALIERGAPRFDPAPEPSAHRYTALAFAAYCGQLEVLNYLLVNVEETPEEVASAFMDAMSSGHTECAGRLHEAGASLDCGALQNAASGNHAAACIWFLEKLRPLAQPEAFGMALQVALESAAQLNAIDAATALLSAGARADGTKSRPLRCATCKNHHEMVSLLIRHGADIDAFDLSDAPGLRPSAMSMYAADNPEHAHVRAILDAAQAARQLRAAPASHPTTTSSLAPGRS